ncbi:MAG: transcription antitermination factor NusB [Terriglobia bacterium]
MPSRHRGREVALQMLFQWDVGRHQPSEVLETFLSLRRLDAETEAFARALFQGTVEHAEALDSLVRAHSEHWRLERMAAVDRNIIRLALFELFHVPENPPAVVVNEAVELARRFSTADSVEFVNGVLEGVRKKQGTGKREQGTGSTA